MFPRQIVGAAFSIGALYANLVNAAPAGHQHGVAPVSSRQSFPVCTDGSIIKNMWLVDQLNVAYTSDELVRPGNASFAITNNLTNTTETIRCSLRANYVCEVHGTPGYDSLQIWLQINLDVARFTLNQSLVCSNAPDSGGSAYAVGTAELYLICQDMSCYSDDDGGGFADGSIMVQTLSPQAPAATGVARS